MIKTKKKSKYISSVLFVLGYVINVIGLVCIVWAATMRSTIEYQLADELKNSDIAELFGISSELTVNIRTVDVTFYVGCAITVLSLIILCIAIGTLVYARQQHQQQNVQRILNVTYDNETKHYNSQFNGQHMVSTQNKPVVKTNNQIYQDSVYSEMEYCHAPTDLYNSTLVCVSGDYLGSSIPINNNEKIIIGNNYQIANIVLNSNNGISACHCSVSFDYFNNCYIITDYSLEGTFNANGERLPQNIGFRMCRGETIVLGDGFNAFRLE